MYVKVAKFLPVGLSQFNELPIVLNFSQLYCQKYMCNNNFYRCLYTFVIPFPGRVLGYIVFVALSVADRGRYGRPH